MQKFSQVITYLFSNFTSDSLVDRIVDYPSTKLVDTSLIKILGNLHDREEKDHFLMSAARIGHHKVFKQFVIEKVNLDIKDKVSEKRSSQGSKK